MLGQPNVKCQWPGYKQSNHTNYEYYKQNTDKYNEMLARKRARTAGGTGSNQVSVHPQRQAYIGGTASFGAANDSNLNQTS